MNFRAVVAAALCLSTVISFRSVASAAEIRPDRVTLKTMRNSVDFFQDAVQKAKNELTRANDRESFQQTPSEQQASHVTRAIVSACFRINYGIGAAKSKLPITDSFAGKWKHASYTLDLIIEGVKRDCDVFAQDYTSSFGKATPAAVDALKKMRSGLLADLEKASSFLETLRAELQLDK